MKWIVKQKRLKTVTFKSLVDFQRYITEYIRAFDDVRDNVWVHV